METDSTERDFLLHWDQNCLIRYNFFMSAYMDVSYGFAFAKFRNSVKVNLLCCSAYTESLF